MSLKLFFMEDPTYHTYIKVPDSNGNVRVVLKRHKFSDTNKVFYFEPGFVVKDGNIVRKDSLYEGSDVLSTSGKGWMPSNFQEYKDFCRTEFNRFKEEEVLVNRFAIDVLGMKEPPYNDRAVTSVRYHL